MGKSCVVVGCESRSNKDFRTPGVTFHGFPPEGDEARVKWIWNIFRLAPGTSGGLWKPYNYAVVCSRHFEDRCYMGGKRIRLLPGAFPTLHMGPNVTEDDLSFPTFVIKAPPSGPVGSASDANEPQQTNLPLLLTPKKEPDDDDPAPPAVAEEKEFLTRKVKRLSFKCHNLKRNLKRAKAALKKVSSVNKLLLGIFPKDDVDHVMQGHEADRLTLLSQLARAKRPRAFSKEIGSFATKIQSISPQCYAFLTDYFCLPSLSTVRHWNLPTKAADGCDQRAKAVGVESSDQSSWKQNAQQLVEEAASTTTKQTHTTQEQGENEQRDANDREDPYKQTKIVEL